MRIYQIVNTPDEGIETESQKYFRELNEKHQKMWDSKFKKMFEALPKDRTKKTIKEKKKIITQMVHAGYDFTKIARLMNYGKGGHTTVSDIYNS